MIAADFNTVYTESMLGAPPMQFEPACNPPNCFKGSYPPITPLGYWGPYWVNTCYLQPARRLEIAGPVSMRSA